MIGFQVIFLSLIYLKVSTSICYDEGFIDYVNENSTWKAGPPGNWALRNYAGGSLLGAQGLRSGPQEYNRSTFTLPREYLPKEFDARVHWPMCSWSINEIRDQGKCCLSCWATAAAAAMSDRVCIHSEGKRNFHVSAGDIVGCCSFGHGCEPGNPYNAWKCWSETGVVSTGCRPSLYNKPCRKQKETLAQCHRDCHPESTLRYENDKHFGKSHYIVEGELGYMTELFLRGPIEVGFDFYADFYCYKSGIYKHVAGKYTGMGHAVKLIGWGEEIVNGHGIVPYWLLANTWGKSWGESGLFRILRGQNEIGIEDVGFAGEPLL